MTIPSQRPGTHDDLPEGEYGDYSRSAERFAALGGVGRGRNRSPEPDLAALHFHDQGRLAALILLGPGTVLESLLERVGKVVVGAEDVIVHVPGRWSEFSSGEVTLLAMLRSFSAAGGAMPTWRAVGSLDDASRVRVMRAVRAYLVVAS